MVAGVRLLGLWSRYGVISGLSGFSAMVPPQPPLYVCIYQLTHTFNKVPWLSACILVLPPKPTTVDLILIFQPLPRTTLEDMSVIVRAPPVQARRQCRVSKAKCGKPNQIALDAFTVARIASLSTGKPVPNDEEPRKRRCRRVVA